MDNKTFFLAIEKAKKISADNCGRCHGTGKHDACGFEDGPDNCPNGHPVCDEGEACGYIKYDIVCNACAKWREPECWHEWEDLDNVVTTDYYDTFQFKCKKCNEERWVRAHPNNDFYSTLDSVIKAIKDSGHWEGFVEHVIEQCLGKFIVDHVQFETGVPHAHVEILTTRELLMEAFIAYTEEVG